MPNQFTTEPTTVRELYQLGCINGRIIDIAKSSHKGTRKFGKSTVGLARKVREAVDYVGRRFGKSAKQALLDGGIACTCRALVRLADLPVTQRRHYCKLVGNVLTLPSQGDVQQVIARRRIQKPPLEACYDQLEECRRKLVNLSAPDTVVSDVRFAAQLLERAIRHSRAMEN